MTRTSLKFRSILKKVLTFQNIVESEVHIFTQIIFLLILMNTFIAKGNEKRFRGHRLSILEIAVIFVTLTPLRLSSLLRPTLLY